MIRHLPFFEVIGNDASDSSRVRVAMAGLLTLRLIDHWAHAGTIMVEPESVSVHSVRNAIADLPPNHPQRMVLFGLVNTMQTSRYVEFGRVVPRLRVYASLLAYDDWAARMAADVRMTADRFDGEAWAIEMLKG